MWPGHMDTIFSYVGREGGFISHLEAIGPAVSSDIEEHSAYIFCMSMDILY